MPALDEHPVTLKTRRLLATVALLLVNAAACRHTEVALVTVRNDTAAELIVATRVPGNSEFTGTMRLAPKQEDILIKYEEDRRKARAIERLVEAMRVEVGSCVASVNQTSIVKSSIRDDENRHWRIHLTQEALKVGGCDSSAPSP